MRTAALFFPFDLFGSAGAGEGVLLLADALREILQDNRREKAPTRARSYARKVALEEFSFEDLPSYYDWQEKARAAIRKSLGKDFLLWFTGNHLGALPLYEELSVQEGESLILQFDAHLDIHHFDECSKELSHGNFLMHCSSPLPTVINVGHRELLLPADHIRKYYRDVIPAEQFTADSDAALMLLQEAAISADRVFIDIDCDVFDPAFFPAVNHRLAFGLSPAQVLRAINAVWSERVVGLSFSEFNPASDRDDLSLTTLIWLMEYLLIKRHE
ncbi:MAG: arginase family protein [Gemmataceae bacterium]